MKRLKEEFEWKKNKYFQYQSKKLNLPLKEIKKMYSESGRLKTCREELIKAQNDAILFGMQIKTMPEK